MDLRIDLGDSFRGCLFLIIHLGVLKDEDNVSAGTGYWIGVEGSCIVRLNGVFTHILEI
jgi:hypothetical protein